MKFQNYYLFNYTNHIHIVVQYLHKTNVNLTIFISRLKRFRLTPTKHEFLVKQRKPNKNRLKVFPEVVNGTQTRILIISPTRTKSTFVYPSSQIILILISFPTFKLLSGLTHNHIYDLSSPSLVDQYNTGYLFKSQSQFIALQVFEFDVHFSDG